MRVMRKDQCLTSSVGPRVKPEDCARMLCIRACFVSLSFAGLVVLARSLNPIPSRTRPLNSSAPMVLWLKPWESRSLPGLPRTKQFLFTCHDQTKRRFPPGKAAFLFFGSGLAAFAKPYFGQTADLCGVFRDEGWSMTSARLRPFMRLALAAIVLGVTATAHAQPKLEMH